VLRKLFDGVHTNPSFIIVEDDGEKLVIRDGTKRTLAAILAGETHVKARVDTRTGPPRPQCGPQGLAQIIYVLANGLATRPRGRERAVGALVLLCQSFINLRELLETRWGIDRGINPLVRSVIGETLRILDEEALES